MRMNLYYHDSPNPPQWDRIGSALMWAFFVASVALIFFKHCSLWTH